MIPAAASSKPTLFVDIEQLPDATYDYLMSIDILIEPYAAIVPSLEKIGRELTKDVGLVCLRFSRYPTVTDVDSLTGQQQVVLPSRTNLALALAVGLDKVDSSGRGPIVDLKAIKNSVEIEGFRQCHLRDGVALVRYFSWLERSLAAGTPVTEAEGADKLEALRGELEMYRGLSFQTISSTGANASIIHYSGADPSPLIDRDEVYLCDSGAQFQDGTTDTTRTLHFGTPRPEEKRAYTRVLQGHAAIDSIVFPATTSGYILDAFARRALWQDGLDYRHGTGHGVGSFLNVHEGPMGIGTRLAYNDVKVSVQPCRAGQCSRRLAPLSAPSWSHRVQRARCATFSFPSRASSFADRCLASDHQATTKTANLASGLKISWLSNLPRRPTTTAGPSSFACRG